MIGKSVSAARCGDMFHAFLIPLTLIGADEENVYFIDCTRDIQGIPYIRVFMKDWEFKNTVTGQWFRLEYECY